MTDRLAHYRYVIYYGWLIANASAGPAAVIGFYYTFEPKYINFSRQVCGLLHAAQVKLFTYINTDYGDRPLAEVAAEANEYLTQGVDGIFFDQVYNFLDDRHTVYYQSLYTLVHERGKTVIVNTGVAQPGEAIMGVTDVLMVEHDWRSLYQANPWFARYPPERFMGDSSNEPGTAGYFDYRVDLEMAVRDTREAWAHGIGWHYSTDHYTTLPAWFLEYARGVERR